jgi:(heptosyl)LPS beta-1,4-glucosyltransferase
VADWVDEVVILDSGSTDRTQEIAERFGARFYRNLEWPGFGRQRQIAQEYVTSDWCFWLDADERVSLELRDEILSVVRQGIGNNVYRNSSLELVFWPIHQTLRLVSKACCATVSHGIDSLRRLRRA